MDRIDNFDLDDNGSVNLFDLLIQIDRQISAGGIDMFELFRLVEYMGACNDGRVLIPCPPLPNCAEGIPGQCLSGE